MLSRRAFTSECSLEGTCDCLVKALVLAFWIFCECSLEGNHKSSLSCSKVIASLFCSKEHPQVFFPLGLGLFCTILFCNRDMKYSEGNHKSMHKLLPLCFALKSIHRSFFSLCLDLLYVFFSSNGASHRRRLQPKRVHRVLPEYV